MNKSLIILTISAIIIGLALIPLFTQDLVDARPTTKKVHFTQTFVSAQDPGRGHENHQFTLILPPEKGIMYDGSLTYTSNVQVQIAILHEINAEDSRGQPIWTVDGRTIYGISLIDTDGKSGSFEFTGAALALHNPNPEQFTATVSVDGWIRGSMTEPLTQSIIIEKEPPSTNLFQSEVPVKIPMHTGLLEEDKHIQYIITDSSDDELAKQISTKQEWNVEVAPILSDVPDTILETIYFFTNGSGGDGMYGFQYEVFSSTPDQTEYSALRKVVNVSWKIGQNPDVLHSVDEILQAEKNGRIELEQTDIILNTPQIVWPDGQMQIRNNSNTHDGGQVLDIDLDSNTVTFTAHRGWGPDGRTIYYIITDATPTGPAEIMGVSDVPSSAELVSSSAVTNMYQFKNGLVGSGPLGFQPIIAAAATGDQMYSPMWKVYLVEWNKPDDTKLLETINDINTARSNGEIIVSIARPTNSDHIINGPFIDPFQNKG